MQNFLSALAQVCTTLIGILLAAITAYFVFLEDRSMQFRDKIEEKKLEIRSDLLRLGGIAWPQGLAFYLPPEFKDRYLSKHPGKSSPELIIQATEDLFFDKPELKESMLELRAKDPFGGPWRGRVYFWILHEAVTAITLNTPDTEIKVFPWSPEGFGFEPWKSEFDKLRAPLQLLSLLRKDMTEDFHQFVDQLPPKYKTMNLKHHYAGAISLFFGAVDSITEKLNSIQTQQILRNGYSFSENVHWCWLLWLIIVSTALGVFIPLFLSLVPQINVARFSKAYLSVTLLVITASFVLFGWDVSRQPAIIWTQFVSDRWYIPMLKLIEREKPHLESGGMLNAEYFNSALNSPDRKWFSKKVVVQLENYIKEAAAYNADTMRFNAAVLDLIHSDKFLAPLLEKPQRLKGEQGQVLYPYNFILSDAPWQNIVDSLAHGSYNYLSVQVFMPRWSHVEFVIPKKSFAQRLPQLVGSLESIRASIKNMESTSNFLSARTRVEAAIGQLEKVLKTARVSK